MDYAYSPAQLELRARARALADEIMVHERACEEHNGLPPEAHRDVAERVRHHGLNAINMPAEWGGQGLGVLDQVVVQEDDEIVAGCALGRIGRSSVTTREWIRTAGGEPVAAAEAVLVARDRASGASRPLAAAERAAFERVLPPAGEPAV